MRTAGEEVLIVERDAAAGENTARMLTANHMRPTVVVGGTAARAALAARPYAILLLEVRLRDEDGLELLRFLAREHDDTAVVVLSADGDMDTALFALQLGADDYLVKPVEAEALVFVVQKVLTRRACAERAPAMVAPEGASKSRELLGESPAMMRVRELLGRAAASGATVLLRGETGTGKDVVAHAIHSESARAGKPFIKVHCAALPENLLESELFGYEKGAFTGAVARKPGRVELAEGGTLFLDEIGDISLATQVKLLRLLEDRHYERLGGVATLRADVRIVCATHRNLEELIKRGAFREDLFYRLNVLTLWLPPLRNRRADVPALARGFCDAACRSHGKSVTFDDSALAKLRSERWPGNVRELAHFVERLVVLGDTTTVTAADVERELTASAPFGSESGSVITTGISISRDSIVPLDETVRRAEQKAIERALAHSKGNKKLAARLLGVSRATLYNKLLDSE